MSQLMPLPLTVSCFSKIQIGFTFLVLAHLGSPGQRAVQRVCVCNKILLKNSGMLLVNKPELAGPQHITTPISPFNSHFPGKFGAACSSSFFFLYISMRESLRVLLVLNILPQSCHQTKREENISIDPSQWSDLILSCLLLLSIPILNGWNIAICSERL